jgi:hypothetical protein
MSDDAVTQALRRALEALIAEARAKGPGPILTEATGDAVLWVGDREEGPPIEWADRPGWPGDPRRRVH